jgi:CheY-like chemotaxis protein
MRHLLVIDADRRRAEILQAALTTTETCDDATVITKTWNAMAFLESVTSWRKSPPSLVILRMDPGTACSWQILARIKQDERLKVLPVIAAIDGPAACCADLAYHMHANCVLSGTEEQVTSRLLEACRFFLNVAESVTADEVDQVSARA